METIDTQLLGEGETKQKPTERKDRAFEMLSNPRRRQVLRYLRTHKGEGPILLRALAEQIAAWENDIPIESVTYKQRKRVYTSLYQSHLPRLHKYGFIEYDANRGTIDLTPEAEQLDIYLEVVPKGDLPWSEIYLGISAIAIAAIVAFWFGAIPFVSSWHMLVALAVLFAGVSIVHTIQTKENAIFNR